MPFEFLVIGSEMLDGGSNTLGLKTVHVCSSNRSIEVRVLRERFKSTSAKRRPLSVNGGSEEYMAAFVPGEQRRATSCGNTAHTLGTAFVRKCFSDLGSEFYVERRTQAGR